jgi:hypothetical protein
MGIVKIRCVVIGIFKVSRHVLRTMVRVGIRRAQCIVTGGLLLRTTVRLILLLAHQSTERIRRHAKSTMAKVIARVLTAGCAETTTARRRNILTTTKSSTTSGLLLMLLIMRN